MRPLPDREQDLINEKLHRVLNTLTSDEEGTSSIEMFSVGLAMMLIPLSSEGDTAQESVDALRRAYSVMEKMLRANWDKMRMMHQSMGGHL